MPRTCLACMEHARHAQSMLGLCTSIFLLISLPISIALFAVRPYTLYRSPFAVCSPVYHSLVPYYRQPFTRTGTRLTVYLPPYDCSPFLFRHIRFIVCFVRSWSFAVVCAEKRYDAGRSNGDGNGNRNAREQEGRKAARQREALWSCLSFVSWGTGTKDRDLRDGKWKAMAGYGGVVEQPEKFLLAFIYTPVISCSLAR
ncbi:hypothetical protein HOY80DRAFT_958857 [Tuber brumale]|nr:hypothetical protein HOY80DRAFT_958857 [Tuber brumale]